MSSLTTSTMSADGNATALALALLPHEDYGPQLNFTVWLLTAVSAGFLCLRLYCKFSRHRGFWTDDHVLIASWAALAIMAAMLSVSISFGFGKHTYDIAAENWENLLLVANLTGSFSILAAALSKTSFAFTLLRISNERWMKWFIWFIIVSMNIALELAILFTWIQCNPVEKTFRPNIPGTCWSKEVILNYNTFTAAYSGAMDIVLAILPWRIIWSLSMNKKEKFGVLFAMSMGVFAGIISFVKIMTIPAVTNADMINTVELVVWGTAESAVTIIACSIPILRALFHDLRPPPGRFLSDEEAASWRSRDLSPGQSKLTSPFGERSSPKQLEYDLEYEPGEMHKRNLSQVSVDKNGLGLHPMNREIIQTNEVRIEYHPRGSRTLSMVAKV